MNSTLSKALLLMAAASFLLGMGYIAFSPFLAGASAPPGVPGTVATTSQATVGTTATTVIATSTCTARIISTVASPIMITFSDAQGATPTGVFGHVQAASTTVAYDSGLYGCGAVKVYSFSASTITVADVR